MSHEISFLRCLTLVAVFILISMGIDKSVYAVPEITLKSQLQEIYNDNVFFTSKDIKKAIKDDFITFFSTGLFFPILKDRLSTSGLNLRILIKQYAQFEKELNLIGQDHSLITQYKLNQRSSLHLKGLYEHDHAQDKELPESGIVITGTRRKYTFFGGYEYLLDMKNTISLTLNHVRTEYSSEIENDYQMNGMNVTLQRELDERMKLGIIYDWKNYDYDEALQLIDDPNYRHYDSGNTKDHSLRVQLAYEFSQISKFSITSGIGLTRYVREQYSINRSSGKIIFHPEYKIRDTRWSIDINALYSLKRLNVNVGINRDLIASSLGYNLEKNQSFFEISYPFSRRVKGSMRASYSETRSVGETQFQRRNEYYDFKTRCTYILTRDINLHFFYSYDIYRTHPSASIERSAYRNKISVGLDVNWL